MNPNLCKEGVICSITKYPFSPSNGGRRFVLGFEIWNSKFGRKVRCETKKRRHQEGALQAINLKV